MLRHLASYQQQNTRLKSTEARVRLSVKCCSHADTTYAGSYCIFAGQLQIATELIFLHVPSDAKSSLHVSKN